ncbi:response regulator [Virgisporangium aurantiacum]|uniref:Response regulator n=1 Tax=Virgisporangium aurantiacum TaxID=175570 RepID=A0A8J3Z1H1_9ACTN|nr:response regulator [Virgisporangium aurantiacum]GIJ54543.1 response regulator [Virgisporangium aurantiacum]
MGARILIVEDNPQSLELMSYLLGAHGYEVCCAATGATAVDAGGSVTVDLVLLDLQLPDIDGYQVLRELRARGTAVKIIAVTAVAMVGDRERTLAAGFDHYIPKPINPRTFVGEVEAWLPPALRGRRAGPAAASRRRSGPAGWRPSGAATG